MSKISLTMGNQATFIIKLKRGNESFPVEDSTEVRVRLIHNDEAMVCTPSINVGEVMINVPAMRCVGSFGIEVTGVYNGARWRTYGAEVIEYTYDTRAGDNAVTVAGDDFEVSMEVQLYVSEVTPSSVATQEWVVEQGYAKSADLADVAISGNYNDLINTPTIPVEQVNADWNATTGKAEILNKPTIPTALADLTQDATHRTVTDTEKSTWNNKSDFSGSYNDLTNKPVIPAAQVNSDWNANSGVAEILNKPTLFSGDYADLTNKPSLATVATSGNYNDLSNKPTIPDVSGKEDKMSIFAGSGESLTAAVNTAYTFASEVGTLAVTLPTPTDTTHVNTIVFWFTTSASPAVTFTSANTVYFHDGYELEASSTYEVNAAYNGSNWIISSIKIATL